MGPRILIVEDDALFLELLADAFTGAGYEAMTAASAEDGIQKAQALRPVALLMDVTLPGLSGWEALKQLKLDARTSDIPVVMLTGHSVDAADHPLAAAVLMKPIRAEVLLETIARVRAQSLRG